MNYRKTPKKIEDMQRENAPMMVKWLDKQIRLVEGRHKKNHKEMNGFIKITSMIFNKFLSYTLPYLKFSGAMQVIAKKSSIDSHD